MKRTQCHGEWCWICGRGIEGGSSFPDHYKWWNVFGCSGQQFSNAGSCGVCTRVSEGWVMRWHSVASVHDFVFVVVRRFHPSRRRACCCCAPYLRVLSTETPFLIQPFRFGSSSACFSWLCSVSPWQLLLPSLPWRSGSRLSPSGPPCGAAGPHRSLNSSK